MPDVRHQLRSIQNEAVKFFAHTSAIAVSSSDLWQSLTPEDRDLKVVISEKLGRVLAKIAIVFQQSPALGDEALRTVRREVRRMDSALRFKDFQSWEASTQYVEDYAIGTTPAGEFENLVSVSTAQSIFEDAIDRILGLLNFAAIPNPAETSARPAISGILSGKRGCSLTTGIYLARALGVSVERLERDLRTAAGKTNRTKAGWGAGTGGTVGVKC